MRVLLIGNANSIHIRRWASSLAGRGLDVSLLSRAQVPVEGVRLIAAEVPSWAPWRPGRWAQRRRGMFRRVVHEVGPDVVNVHYLGPYSVFPEDLGGARLLVNTWGSDVIPLGPEPPEQRRQKIRVLRSADRLMSSSHHLARATCEYAGLAQQRVVTNHWGVELDRFGPPGTPSDEPVVGFVKSLQPHYGPRTLLTAFAEVVQAVPGAKLLMAGRVDELRTELENQAAGLGISSKIEWLGHVDYDEVPGLFRRMGVSAMPSTREAFGMAAIESQAIGVPVVASTVGGLPEVVVDGQTGLLVPPDDPPALARALIRVLSDRKLRHRLGRQGRAHVEANFDFNATVDRMVATYEEMVSGPGRPERASAGRSRLLVNSSVV